MTAVQHTSATTHAAIGNQPPGSALRQQPRAAQQRTGHSLAQRGMLGRQPPGVQQGQGEASGKPPLDEAERTNQAAMQMNAQFNAQKNLADTLNGMINGVADSASKAISASSEAARGIRV